MTSDGRPFQTRAVEKARSPTQHLLYAIQYHCFNFKIRQSWTVGLICILVSRFMRTRFIKTRTESNKYPAARESFKYTIADTQHRLEERNATLETGSSKQLPMSIVDGCSSRPISPRNLRQFFGRSDTCQVPWINDSAHGALVFLSVVSVKLHSAYTHYTVDQLVYNIRRAASV